MKIAYAHSNLSSFSSSVLFYFRFVCLLTSHIFQAHNGRRGRKKKKKTVNDNPIKSDCYQVIACFFL